MNILQNLWIRKRWVIVLLCIAVVSLLAFGTFRFAKAVPNIPTTLVQHGEFVDYLQVRGESQAERSVTITAPADAGDLEILKLTNDGQSVKKGDVVVEFDTTTLKQTLVQDQSTVKSADAEIQQSRAQAHMKEEQDLTDVMKARYDVEAATLDANKQEILSKIEGEEAQLKLEDAKQKLHEMEEKLKADKSSDTADIHIKQEAREKSLHQVERIENTLKTLVLTAPSDGTVSVGTNWRAGRFGSGPFKTGDSAWPGAAVVEIPDLSSLIITARIDESDRGQIRDGQPVSVRIDAIPDQEFNGHISEISTIASIDFSGSWPYPKNFSMKVSLDKTDPRLRPGMSTTLRVAMDRIPNALTIPAGALFHEEGQNVVYVLNGPKFEERFVQVTHQSNDQVLIAKGLQAGDRVALQKPTMKE